MGDPDQRRSNDCPAHRHVTWTGTGPFTAAPPTEMILHLAKDKTLDRPGESAQAYPSFEERLASRKRQTELR